MMQYQTIPIKLGINWYHLVSPKYIKYCHQYDTSTVMILSLYGTDGFVSVLYHHDTDSGNFQKNFDA